MTTELDPLPSSTPASRAAALAPRLWPAIVLVAVFWAGYFLVGAFEKSFFLAFLYSAAAPAVLVLLFSIWWWSNRRIPITDRVLGCLMVIATGVAVAPFCDKSIGLGLGTSGLPLAITALTLWMMFIQWTGFAWKRLGLLVVLARVWGSFTLVRVDGVNADLKSTIRWRWNPSPEDMFLAQLEQQTDAVSPATPPSPQEALTLSPGDWTSFRGPDRDGVIHGITIDANWTANPPKELWRRRVGPAWSSVIVIGERLFTQEQRGEEETVVCYDASTGNEVWVHADPECFWEAVSGAGPRATPTFAGGRILTLGAKCKLNCLDAATGETRWSHNIVEEAPSKLPMWAFSSSPLVVNDKVIVFAGGQGDRNLLAYQIESGELAWAAPVSHDSYSSPQLATLDGCQQCLMLGDHGLTAIDPASGSVLWQFGLAMAGAPRMLQAHILGNSQLVAGTLSGEGVALADVTREGDRWNVAEVWSTTKMKPEFSDFVVQDGHAYGFDGAIFCCLDLSTGARSWKAGRYGRGQVMLLPEQSLLLVISENGAAVLLNADPRRHQEIGRFQALAEKTWNHPVIAHGRLFVRNAEEMAC